LHRKAANGGDDGQERPASVRAKNEAYEAEGDRQERQHDRKDQLNIYEC
jgi:hypothetical protein